MLKNRTALITGASRGIGKAIALKMAEQGANIAVVYGGNQQGAETTVKTLESMGVKAKSYQCDVSSFEDTKTLVTTVLQDFSRIDILVNNAGITRDALVLSMKEKDFDDVIHTNLKGAFHMMKHCYQPFMKQKYGKIINISSVVGLSGNKGQANYSSAKAGLIGLTKSVAKELAGRNVTCNAIAPGFIVSDMTEVLSDAVKDATLEAIPMKKMGQGEDVANLAMFLASDCSSYITGEVIKVDGGLYI